MNLSDPSLNRAEVENPIHMGDLPTITENTCDSSGQSFPISLSWTKLAAYASVPGLTHQRVLSQVITDCQQCSTTKCVKKI